MADNQWSEKLRRSPEIAESEPLLRRIMADWGGSGFVRNVTVSLIKVYAL